MNKLRYLIGIIVVLFLFTSCEDEDSLDLSTITDYAVFTLSGDVFYVVNLGETYTEPGIIATEGDNNIEFTTEGAESVNTATPGIFTITYSAVNTDGYSSSAYRYVIVMDKASFSGHPFDTDTYLRTQYGTGTSGGGFAVWNKTAEQGKYLVNNPGGVSGDETYLYDIVVFQVDATHFVVPTQANVKGGTIICTSTKGGSESDVIEHSGTEYIWSVKGSGYGTNLRTFTKQ